MPADDDRTRRRLGDATKSRIADLASGWSVGADAASAPDADEPRPPAVNAGDTTPVGRQDEAVAAPDTELVPRSSVVPLRAPKRSVHAADTEPVVRQDVLEDDPTPEPPRTKQRTGPPPPPGSPERNARDSGAQRVVPATIARALVAASPANREDPTDEQPHEVQNGQARVGRPIETSKQDRDDPTNEMPSRAATPTGRRLVTRQPTGPYAVLSSSTSSGRHVVPPAATSPVPTHAARPTSAPHRSPATGQFPVIARGSPTGQQPIVRAPSVPFPGSSSVTSRTNSATGRHPVIASRTGQYAAIDTRTGPQPAIGRRTGSQPTAAPGDERSPQRAATGSHPAAAPRPASPTGPQSLPIPRPASTTGPQSVPIPRPTSTTGSHAAVGHHVGASLLPAAPIATSPRPMTALPVSPTAGERGRRTTGERQVRPGRVDDSASPTPLPRSPSASTRPSSPAETSSPLAAAMAAAEARASRPSVERLPTYDADVEELVDEELEESDLVVAADDGSARHDDTHQQDIAGEARATGMAPGRAAATTPDLRHDRDVESATEKFQRADPTLPPPANTIPDSTRIEGFHVGKYPTGGTLRATAALRRKRGVFGDVRYVLTVVFGIRQSRRELADLEHRQNVRQISRRRHLITLGRAAAVLDTFDHPGIGQAREQLALIEDERSMHSGAVAASDAELERVRRDRESKSIQHAADVSSSDAAIAEVGKLLEPLEKEAAAAKRRGAALREELHRIEKQIADAQARLSSQKPDIDRAAVQADIATRQANKEAVLRDEPVIASELDVLNPRIAALEATRSDLQKKRTELDRMEVEDQRRTVELLEAIASKRKVVERGAADAETARDNALFGLGERLYLDRPRDLGPQLSPIDQIDVEVAEGDRRLMELKEILSNVDKAKLARGVAMVILALTVASCLAWGLLGLL